VLALKEKTKTEPPVVKKEASKEPKQETKSETASADSVRERLLQSALDRAKSKGETSQNPAKGEILSSGAGEGEGAAALGQGGQAGRHCEGHGFYYLSKPDAQHDQGKLGLGWTTQQPESRRTFWHQG
jgi:hypothetical protein